MILFETVSFVAANLKNLKKLAPNGYTWVEKNMQHIEGEAKTTYFLLSYMEKKRTDVV